VILLLALTVFLLLLPPPAVGQVCTGDCGSDGEVTVDDVITMVNIAQMNAMLDSCPAADPNGDGEVTIDEIITAVGFALSACPAPMRVEVRVGTASAAPGQTGNFDVTLKTAGEQIDALQFELRFPEGARVAAATNGDPDCVSTTGSLAIAFLPLDCPVTECTGIRATYARQSTPDNTILLSCVVRVDEGGTPGSRLPLSCVKASYVDGEIEEHTAACVDGSIDVTS
jgi:hypothetical protein